MNPYNFKIFICIKEKRITIKQMYIKLIVKKYDYFHSIFFYMAMGD